MALGTASSRCSKLFEVDKEDDTDDAACRESASILQASAIESDGHIAPKTLSCWTERLSRCAPMSSFLLVKHAQGAHRETTTTDSWEKLSINLNKSFILGGS